MAKDANSAETPRRSIDSTSSPSYNPHNQKENRDSFWPRLTTKDELPIWLRDNGFIMTRHPMPTYSYKRSFRLWWCVHMETMNIWTHIFGCIAFVIIGIVLHNHASAESLQPTIGDKFAFGISITTGAVCFGLSTTFHTLRSHSYNVHHFWGRLDIFGICLLGLGGGASATYYAFYCNPKVQRIYWALNACAALGAAIILFDTGGGGTKMRTLRGGTFMLLATTAMLPIFHGTGKLGWHQACQEIGAQWYLSEGLVLCFGVTMFVARLPERLSPGRFDVWGHSHQLHHICAVVGTAFHVAALVTGFKYRQGHLGC